METFKAFLDYFTLTQWIAIGIICRVLFWVAEKMTDRYLNRWKLKQRQKSHSQRENSASSPPDHSKPE